MGEDVGDGSAVGGLDGGEILEMMEMISIKFLRKS